MVYLAEDERTAMREARPHADYFAERCFAIPLQMLIPPGYASTDSLRRLVRTRGAQGASFEFDSMTKNGQALIGTPDQVGERLTRMMERAGAGVFMGMFQFGDMPHGRAMRNMELFATKVMPYLPKTAPVKTAAPAPAV
jgi:alkanesulfonate monooxygenase SsuD/methylene tetrahydromethanopterin reductase-like flavin-dependent oxidoreductase (luciferase family)